MNRYFARVTAGTETLAEREIAQLDGVQPLATEQRRLDFMYVGHPADLLDLRSVDDVYVYVGELAQIDHTRAMLAAITAGVAQLDWGAALQPCRQVRPLPRQPSYTITASLLGGRNYTRFEVAAAVQAGLARRNWRYVVNEPQHAPVDLDVRVLVEGDAVLVGLRLGETPLHRRPYKLTSLPGSLKPPVAYCLNLFAEIPPGAVLLDPLCGAGTIPIEAAAFGVSRLLAGDVNPEAVACAAANSANAGLPVWALHADARQLPLPDQSVDRIVSNVPWGKQVLQPDALPALYAALIREFARVLRPNGRCVLLTDRGDLLLPAAAERFRLITEQPISLYGSHPTIYSLARAQ
ncbi:MAG: methyltransferase domain-containing protein [Chloroflexi bacterium]|uniref:methyltransferase domain-containing protein n=1 Tax=Candidatus Flexifilum breve TaxID=3140694 RepID=UPI0031372244|nr:methyltransferase domain-containing protein [Chloroflexota bacterium]